MVCSRCSAALTARSGSSSRTAGTPKTPTTASPMNFSTTPPWDSITVVARAKYSPSRRSTSSGSAASLMAVKPTRSQKSAVTTLSSSEDVRGVTSAVAHFGQKAKSSEAS